MEKSIFSCVYCGEDVHYLEKTQRLVCSNPKCPEDDSSYGWNPLQGDVWVRRQGEKGTVWDSVPKKYVLEHIGEFIKEK